MEANDLLWPPPKVVEEDHDTSTGMDLEWDWFMDQYHDSSSMTCTGSRKYLPLPFFIPASAIFYLDFLSWNFNLAHEILVNSSLVLSYWFLFKNGGMRSVINCHQELSLKDDPVFIEPCHGASVFPHHSCAAFCVFGRKVWVITN